VANEDRTEWLTTEEAKEHLGVSSTTTLNRWRAGSGLPYHKTPSGAVRYDRAEIDEWVRSQRNDSE